MQSSSPYKKSRARFKNRNHWNGRSGFDAFLNLKDDKNLNEKLEQPEQRFPESDRIFQKGAKKRLIDHGLIGRPLIDWSKNRESFVAYISIECSFVDICNEVAKFLKDWNVTFYLHMCKIALHYKYARDLIEILLGFLYYYKLSILTFQMMNILRNFLYFVKHWEKFYSRITSKSVCFCSSFYRELRGVRYSFQRAEKDRNVTADKHALGQLDLLWKPRSR